MATSSDSPGATRQTDAPAPPAPPADERGQDVPPAYGVAPGGPPTDELDPSLEPDVFARDCASRPVLQDVTGRWGTLALAALHEGPVRFNALRRRIDGVSEKMLAQTLQALERDGFVLRDVQGTIPPRVEYRLTPLGTTVTARLVGLLELIEDSIGEVVEAQRAYDAR